MSESESRDRLWLRRSEEGGVGEVMTESERRKEREEREREEGKKGAEGPTEPGEPGEPEKGAQEEGPIWRGKPVLGAFYPFHALGALALACTAVAELALPLPLWTVGVLVPLSSLVIALPFALRLAWSFVLTDREAESEFRLWVGRSRSAPLDRATDVVAEQGPVARLLGFGSVRIDTAGTPFPGVEFWGIEDPFRVEERAREAVANAEDVEG